MILWTPLVLVCNEDATVQRLQRAKLYARTSGETLTDKQTKQQQRDMKLGAFSVSLNVKDIEVSKQFYESLGFTVFAGSMASKYLIMKNEHALVGLFQGMFEGNILTFNPGWDYDAQNLEQFDDIRTIQRELKSQGLSLSAEADESTTGPASIMLTDPDGNVILLAQHREGVGCLQFKVW